MSAFRVTATLAIYVLLAVLMYELIAGRVF